MVFDTVNLRFHLDFYLYSTDFEVHSVPLRLFSKTSKVLMRFIFKIFILKMLCFFFHETFFPVKIELPLRVRITLDVNDYI